MDLGAALSVSSYSYQTTTQNSGSSAGVVQALSQAYDATAAATSPSSSDPLAALAGASAIGPLVSGLTALTQANQPSGQGVQGVSFASSYGGLDLTSATSLLAGLGSGSDSAAGLQGFGSAVSGPADLAAAGYLAQQAYGAQDPAATTQAQAAVAQAQAATSASTLSLLA
jgi:hypothetical protein